MKTNRILFLYLSLFLGILLPFGFGCKSSDDSPKSPTSLKEGNNTTVAITASINSSGTVVIDGGTLYTHMSTPQWSTVNVETRLELGNHTLETFCVNDNPDFNCSFNISFTARLGNTTYTPTSFIFTQTPASKTQTNKFVVSLTSADL